MIKLIHARGINESLRFTRMHKIKKSSSTSLLDFSIGKHSITKKKRGRLSFGIFAVSKELWHFSTL